MADMSDMKEYLNMFPETMLAFFKNITVINTPMGYIDVYFFSYMQVIIGIFAVSAGSGLIAADEEKGILDLVLAQPVSRSALYFGRLAGIATALFIILAAGWLSWVLPAGSTGFALSPLQLLQAFLSLFAILLFFTAFAVFFSMILPAARMAAMLAGALLAGNYLLLGLANIYDGLQAAARLTPLYYYQGGMAVIELNTAWLAGLLASFLLLVFAAWLLFLNRDIRVGGEGSWNLKIIK